MIKTVNESRGDGQCIQNFSWGTWKNEEFADPDVVEGIILDSAGSEYGSIVCFGEQTNKTCIP
jgi:hypothetical protein